jgi:predicted dehydrogenase
MQSGKLQCGVVGMGHIGKRHAAMIDAHPECNLQAVCDLYFEERRNVSGVEQYPNFSDMIENEKLDILSVCVPNHLHVPFSSAAIENDIHVICEKPLGLHFDACHQLIKLANDKGKNIFCVLQNRYSPTVQWLQYLIQEERLGKIFHVQINCLWNRDDRYYFIQDEDGKKHPHPWHGSLRKDGGPLFTQFSHFIDILIALFGKIEIEDARFFDFNHGTSTEFEDSGSVRFSTQTKAQGYLMYSTSIWGQNAESSMNIIGSKGTVKVGGQYMNHIDYCHVKDYTAPKLPETNAANHYGGYSGSANNHYFIFKNVADVLLRGAKPDFPIEDAVHGVEVIEHIYRHRKEE